MTNQKPVRQMSKADIVWLATHFCKHRHPYLEHRSCYRPGQSTEERVGFLDIETEDLKADYGIMFSWCIKEKGGKILFDVLRPQDVKRGISRVANEDKRLTEGLISALRGFDRVIGHYSSCFDLPFIRTRAIICGLDFPEYGVYVQSDTWRILRSKFKLSRNSLENACRKLLGHTEKNYLSLALKHGCLRGEKWALDATLEHNKRDVRDTERLYCAIAKFARKTNSSI